MKEKTLHLLELDDDKMGIINLLKEETKDTTIEPYVDYRDFEGVERLVVKCKTLDEFECELQEVYDEDIAYEQNELIGELVKKVKSVYTGYDDLSDNLYDYIAILYNMEQYPINLCCNVHKAHMSHFADFLCLYRQSIQMF